MLHRQRALYVLSIWFCNYFALALTFYLHYTDLEVGCFCAFNKFCLGPKIKKQCKLISPKHLVDALPVLRIIQIMMTEAGFILRKV